MESMYHNISHESPKIITHLKKVVEDIIIDLNKKGRKAH